MYWITYNKLCKHRNVYNRIDDIWCNIFCAFLNNMSNSENSNLLLPFCFLNRNFSAFYSNAFRIWIKVKTFRFRSPIFVKRPHTKGYLHNIVVLTIVVCTKLCTVQSGNLIFENYIFRSMQLWLKMFRCTLKSHTTKWI